MSDKFRITLIELSDRYYILKRKIIINFHSFDSIILIRQKVSKIFMKLLTMTMMKHETMILTINYFAETKSVLVHCQIISI